ncbi:MAG: tripartite tricarboxylate transporter substrate binding protein [Alphaproteobacteria bacterium]|nr:tripartite tricarboxylate transporter substrate binding protein [Alphaproteobacteria bacterium]
MFRAVAALVLLLLPSLAEAQPYPSRPIRIVVGFAPGTATDNLVRPLAELMSADLKQPVIIDNKVGAQGSIAADHVAKAPADGYTLLAGSSTTQAANPSLFKQLTYNPRVDFAAITRMGAIAQVMVVNNEVPAKSVTEFVSWVKANKDKAFYAQGSSGNLIPSAALSERLGLGMTQVSFRSPPQALVDVIGGRVPMMFVDMSAGLGQIKSGQVRALAVSSKAPSRLLPDVPPLAGTLPGFELTTWFGLYAPKGTPAAVIAALNKAARDGLSRPDFQAKMAETGFELDSSTPEELHAFTVAEIDKWAALVKEAKIEAQ